MRSQLIIAASMLLAAPVVAQPAVTTVLPSVVLADAAEVQAVIAKVKASQKPGQPSGTSQPLVSVPGYRTMVEYRTAPTPASIHDNESELIYVVEGSGSMTLGGTLNDAKRSNPANQQGSGVTGGTSHALAKGSFMFIPAGTAHYFASIGKTGLAIVTLKVPTTTPS
ncbi:cupin domain-containing protein [Glacieibacterium sp.]|uniref:cupin domain-containing protein n=1 Tax=Glacieibacterium sp. TaxID=2860237 RepID=UPI003B0084B7